MTLEAFRDMLERVRESLERQAKLEGFSSATDFERAVFDEICAQPEVLPEDVNYLPGSQRFPDIVISELYGIEVKYKQGPVPGRAEKWREVANSVLEGSRSGGISEIYIMFCRMGSDPEVRLRAYAQAVYHVRTSHAPRFAISMEDDPSLFGRDDGIPVSYESFRLLEDKEKLRYIKEYARRRHPNDWLWWVGDPTESQLTSDLVLQNYTQLTIEQKRRLAAEALIICPRCLAEGQGGKGRIKTVVYATVGSYWLRAHGVYSGNVRDALTAGSMVDPCADSIRMRCLVEHVIKHIVSALWELDDDVIQEFWGQSVALPERMFVWLKHADSAASGWVPSETFDWEALWVEALNRDGTRP